MDCGNNCASFKEIHPREVSLIAAKKSGILARYHHGEIMVKKKVLGGGLNSASTLIKRNQYGLT